MDISNASMKGGEIMKRINKSGLSLALVLAGMLTSGVAWAACCLDSGQCKYNPTNDCGRPINDYYDWCSTGECCHIRVYQCYPGDTCRARDTAPLTACPAVAAE